MYRKLIPVVLVPLVLVAACGQSDDDDNGAAATTTTAAVAAPTTVATPTTVASTNPPGDVISAKVGESDLGDVIVSTAGMTLYGFLNDVDATSTCSGTCAEAWPPVIVDENWTVGPGLDTGIFATTVREDGSLQLVAGKWPLYTYSGDAAPGDVTGQGSGDVWFAVGTDGALIEGDGAPTGDTAVPTTSGDPYGGDYGGRGDYDETAEPTTPATTTPAAPAIVGVATTPVGDGLVDANGFTLYGFMNDVDGVPTCEADCADAWPGLIVDSADLPAGLDAAVFSVVQRSDGTFQLKAGAWPLYRFAGDANPGEANGQGTGGVWFVADPAGGLIKD